MVIVPGELSFDTKEESGTFDCVAILPAGKGRAQAARVLRMGSLFVFLDPMHRRKGALGCVRAYLAR